MTGLVATDLNKKKAGGDDKLSTACHETRPAKSMIVYEFACVSEFIIFTGNEKIFQLL